MAFTPPELANRTPDTLIEMWADGTVRLLAPFTKTGVSLRGFTTHLVKGLVGEIPDLRGRVEHILTKQMHGIAITHLTSLLARRSAYGSRHANDPRSIIKILKAAAAIPDSIPQNIFGMFGMAKTKGANSSERIGVTMFAAKGWRRMPKRSSTPTT